MTNESQTFTKRTITWHPSEFHWYTVEYQTLRMCILQVTTQHWSRLISFTTEKQDWFLRFLKYIHRWSKPMIVHKNRLLPAKHVTTRSSFCIIYYIYTFLCYSYLAEAPYACKDKIRNLLEFIFSIEGQDEPRLLLLYLFSACLHVFFSLCNILIV